MEIELNSEGRKIQIEFSDFIAQCAKYFSRYDFLRDSETALREMKESIVRPFNVAVFGRMKTGKSTLINALIGKPLAITGVNEATATINVISYASTADLLGKFTVYWKDSSPQSFPLECLQSQWAGKSDDVLDRVKRTKFLQLYSDSKILGLHEIIDTPGTGSVAQEHEDVAQKFISASEDEGRKADALIYVFPPVGRESDEASLQSFREGRLENSTPYNSVAVMHKWDEILYSEGSMDGINQKAQRIYETMKDMVATVIPVSGPLALAAETASGETFGELVKLCEVGFEKIKPFLGRDEKWDKDATRQRIRKEFGIPWASFRLLVKTVAEGGFDEKEARHRILELSGIEKLRNFIDKNFFKRAAIIRQNQILAKVESIKRKSDEISEEKTAKTESDLEYFEELQQMQMPPNIKEWIHKNVAEKRTFLLSLSKDAVEFGHFFANSKIKKAIDDYNAIEWIANNNILTPEYLKIAKKILTHMDGSDALGIPSRIEVSNILGALATIPLRISNRKVLEYIRQRITTYQSNYFSK